MLPSRASRTLRTLGCLGGIAFALALSASPAEATPKTTAGGVTLITPSTDVTMRLYPGGPPEAVPANRRLRSGNVIATVDRSARLAFSDGTMVTLAPRTTVQIQAPTEAMLAVGSRSTVSRLDLLAGSIGVSIASGARPALVATRGDALAAFRSGTGRMSMHSSGMTVVVEDGSGMMATRGRWTPIPAGSYLSAGSDGRVELRRLAVAPVFSSEVCEAAAERACAIAVTTSDSPATVAARWAPLPAGLRPVIELSHTVAGQPHRVAEQVAAEGSVEFSASLPAGAYTLRVRGRGADGVDGIAAEKTLRIVRLAADSETRPLARGAGALIPYRHTLELDDARDLMVDEPGDVVVPDPRRLGLRDGESQRMLRFTIASQPNERAWFTLRPRVRSAEVSLSPGTAVWPRDPVEIAVRLHDNAGQAPQLDQPPDLRVEMNGQPLNVVLRRDGARWLGRIAPRGSRGPWSIRASVFDSEDNCIGFGGLHVESVHALRSRTPSLFD